jgi:hypothetical protein
MMTDYAATAAYPRHSEAHLHAFRMWELTMDCKNLPEHELTALCEDRNFIHEVAVERQRRAKVRAELLSPAVTRTTATQATPSGWQSKSETLAQWFRRARNEPVLLKDVRMLVMALVEKYDAQLNELHKKFEAHTWMVDGELQKAAIRREAGAAGVDGQRGVPNVRWAGTYEAGHEYQAGELCTRGGLWLCTADTTSAAPGSDPSAWKLVVSRKMVPSDDR